MKEIIPTRQIETGMFVIELDRPWLETPFLPQGLMDAYGIDQADFYLGSA